MKYNAIRFSFKDEKILSDFIDFPETLYAKNELMQNKSDELKLLKGTHLLSKYFEAYPFIALDENKKIAARCVLTIYPDRECAYIGFFESINDKTAAAAVMNKTEDFARQLGFKSVIGPVDCSFWIRYRLKTNKFDIPYSGEPYNKDYYESFFIDNGYTVIGEYISNRFKRVENLYKNKKFEIRLSAMRERGYTILSPTNKTFDKALKEIYSMLIELYSDFQTFSRITEEEFINLYTPLKKVVNYNMVKVAYFNGKAVGFFVSIPNFNNNINGEITLCKLIKILKTKLICHDYVMLYMGVDSEHRGLGKALAEAVCKELSLNGAESVGALIRKGKVNGNYFSDLIDFKYEYKLFEKNI